MDKTEQGLYNRYPSERSPGEYRLRKKGNVKRRYFNFLERGGDVRDARARSRWSDEQHDIGEMEDYSMRQERSEMFRPEVTEGRVSMIRDEE